jgi:transitional endoplasmic reticulum ATPase
MSLLLAICNAPLQLSKTGKAWLHPETIEHLGLDESAVIEIRSGFRGYTLARVVSSAEVDKETIGLDRYQRQAVKASLGGKVQVEKADTKPLSRLYVLPCDGLHSFGTELKESLRQHLISNLFPVCQGSIIPINLPVSGRSATFKVSSIEPNRGIVTVNTMVEILADTDSHHRGEVVTFDDVGGLTKEIEMVREQVELPLRYPDVYSHLGIKSPRGIILHGPPGVGKTYLALAIANEVGAEFFYINGPEIVSTEFGETENRLRDIFHEASHHQPSVIVMDELDVIAPKRGETGSFSSTRIVAQLLTLLDGLKKMDGVIVIGTTNRIEAVDTAMRRAGRFDKEVFIGPPDINGRLEILRVHTRGMPLTQEVADHLQEIARKTFGFVGADFVELCREAGLNALRRTNYREIGKIVPEEICVEKADFEEALEKCHPSALRESMVVIPDVKWNDIGGLSKVKQRLQERVQLPFTHPETLREIGIKPPTGVLLYGPPGTGKTLLARALATECQANFISLTGPEIFSKWLGESEEQVRYIFRLAKRVTPCILFFDQLDAIAPHRGRDISTQVSQRVVNQLLAELDGLEAKNGIVVIGATNRIDLIDPSLLRAGRLGIHISVPLPDEQERREILRLFLQGIPLKPGTQLDDIVNRLAAIQGLSGADLQMVCEEAKISAVIIKT